jgi:hypothetical protein
MEVKVSRIVDDKRCSCRSVQDQIAIQSEAQQVVLLLSVFKQIGAYLLVLFVPGIRYATLVALH